MTALPMSIHCCIYMRKLQQIPTEPQGYTSYLQEHALRIALPAALLEEHALGQVAAEVGWEGADERVVCCQGVLVVAAPACICLACSSSSSSNSSSSTGAIIKV
jgi:hypothetical protein